MCFKRVYHPGYAFPGIIGFWVFAAVTVSALLSRSACCLRCGLLLFFFFCQGAVPCFYLSAVVSLNSKAGVAGCSYQTRHALNVFTVSRVTAVIPPVWLCRAFSCSAKRHFCWKSLDGKKLFVASDSTCRDTFFLELGKVSKESLLNGVSQRTRGMMLHAPTGSSCAGIGTWKSSDSVNVFEVVFCQATTALRVADAPASPVSPPGRRRVTCCPGRTVDGDPSSPTIHIRDLPPPHRLVAGQNFGSQAAAFPGARSSATPAPELLSAGAAPTLPNLCSPHTPNLCVLSPARSAAGNAEQGISLASEPSAEGSHVQDWCFLRRSKREHAPPHHPLPSRPGDGAPPVLMRAIL